MITEWATAIASDHQIFKETFLVNKFLKAVYKASFGSDFEHYYRRVRKNSPYSPTVDEAKKDYRSTFHGRF